MSVLTFTSANTVVLINDRALSGIYNIEVSEHVSDVNKTFIHIDRHVIGGDELVNEMRSTDFTLRLLNHTSSAGYVAATARIDSFHMSLSKEDDGTISLLKQNITVVASSFVYVTDARSVGMKVSEEEDFKNLVNIIKENQAKTAKVVLPDSLTTSKISSTWRASKQIEEEEEENERILKVLNETTNKKTKKNKKMA